MLNTILNHLKQPLAIAYEILFAAEILAAVILHNGQLSCRIGEFGGGILGLFVTTPGLLYIFNVFLRYFRSKSWLRVPGVIVTSMTVKSGDTSSDGETMYEASVWYKYTVAGKAYGSKVIYPLDKFSITWISVIDRITSKYTPHQEVMVYCNPSNHEEVFLERRGLFYIILIALILLGFFSVSFLLSIGIMDSNFNFGQHKCALL